MERLFVLQCSGSQTRTVLTRAPLLDRFSSHPPRIESVAKAPEFASIFRFTCLSYHRYCATEVTERLRGFPSFLRQTGRAVGLSLG